MLILLHSITFNNERSLMKMTQEDYSIKMDSATADGAMSTPAFTLGS